MTKNKLGVCIVGCGFMGSIHAERWSKLPDAQVVAAVDILEERAQNLARQYALPTWYTDYRLAVSLPEVDVVSVCTPTCLHAEISIAAAERGKHVLSEKPIALQIEQAEAMITAAEYHGVELGVGFMRRHSPVLSALRNLIQIGKLGRPLFYSASDIRQVRPKLAMHDAEQNGGPALDMAVHYLDQWSYLFDSQPIEVAAHGFSLASERPELASIRKLAPDTATLLVRYASGDIGSFTVCWGLPPGVNPPARADQIYAPNGLLEAVWEMGHQHARWMKEGGEWETIASSDDDMYQNEIASMARHILEGLPHPGSGLDGVRALRTALAGLQSIQLGQPVFLD